MSDTVQVRFTGIIELEPEGRAFKDVIADKLGVKVLTAQAEPPAPVCPHCGGGEIFSKYKDGGSTLYCKRCGDQKAWPNPNFRPLGRRGW